jgi:dodecin
VTPDLSEGATIMTVAKVSEITAQSSKSFEDAIQQGITRAGKTIRNIQSAWVNEQNVVVKNGKVAEWRVNLRVTFLLDD